MSIKADYKQFLENNFPNQEIKGGLFWGAKNGLRFDLQSSETGTDDYFVEVIKRSTQLFEAAFKDTDEIFLTFTTYKWKRRKIRFGNYCFKRLTDLKKDKIAYFTVNNRYEKGDSYNMAVIKTQVNSVGYKNILTAIANSDFPSRQPRFAFLDSPEIFFVNTTAKLIFHMYDDRGLDIVATNIMRYCW